MILCRNPDGSNQTTQTVTGQLIELNLFREPGLIREVYSTLLYSTYGQSETVYI